MSFGFSPRYPIRRSSQSRKQPERDLQNAIISLLNMKGHFAWKIPNRGFQMPNGAWIPSANKGIPDILGVHKDSGKILAIECKVGKNKATDIQNAFLEEITKRGGIAKIAYSIEDIQDI